MRVLDPLSEGPDLATTADESDDRAGGGEGGRTDVERRPSSLGPRGSEEVMTLGARATSGGRAKGTGRRRWL
jgi:hypothetical protein